MVCLGNICRSPMAQGILEHKVNQEGLEVEVDSAGTSSYHIDEHPDHRAIKKCADYGIDIQHYRGRQLQQDDFEYFDAIYVMDSSNLENSLSVSRSETESAKVEMILNLIDKNSNQSVPDPYFGGEDGFEAVYQMLDQACDQIIRNIKSEQA